MEEHPLRPVKFASAPYDPTLQSFAFNPISLRVDDYLEDRGEGRPWQATLRVFADMANVDVCSVKEAGRLQVKAMPPSLRIDDGDCAPAFRHANRIAR